MLSYAAIKELHLSGWGEKYYDDLTISKGWPEVHDLITYTDMSLTRDVPNSGLIFTGGKWGSNEERSFTLRSIEEKNTEVSFRFKYRLTIDASARELVILTLSSLLMLEYGYKQASKKE